MIFVLTDKRELALLQGLGRPTRAASCAISIIAGTVKITRAHIKTEKGFCVKPFGLRSALQQGTTSSTAFAANSKSRVP
jgi:hypothetical protein